MVYNFFGKKAFGGAIKNENVSNKELGKESNKPIVKKIQEKI